MLQLINEAFCLFAAFTAGCFAYRFMTVFFRLLFLQIVVWLLFYTSCYALTWYQTTEHLPIDNQWLMNIHLLLETGLLYAAAWFSFSGEQGKLLSLSAYLLFLVVFVVQGAGNGFSGYSNFADVTACIGITVVYTTLLYHTTKNGIARWWSSPEKLAYIGLLIYFACSVPYVSLMHYLQLQAPKINTFLYHFINDGLANTRYLLTAISFYFIYRNAQQLHTP